MTNQTAKGAAVAVTGGSTAGRIARILGGLAAVAALALLPGGEARAHWSTSSGGYGGYGAGMGMTPYDQELLKEQIAGLNQSQYELNLRNAFRARVDAEMMAYKVELIREQARLARVQAYRQAVAAGLDPAPAEKASAKVAAG